MKKSMGVPKTKQRKWSRKDKGPIVTSAKSSSYKRTEIVGFCHSCIGKEIAGSWEW